MFTPQQIDQISFGRSAFGGYDMQQVDEFLEPLTEDSVTLYKENALLKSKMRVLVGKLEEYRKNEAAMKEAVLNAQKTSEKMIREAEAKCAQMLNSANATAAAKAAEAAEAAAAVNVAETAKQNDALIAAENARVEEARRTAAVKINELQEQLRSCVQALERIKNANAPAAPVAPRQSPLPSPLLNMMVMMWQMRFPEVWKIWSAPPLTMLPRQSPSILSTTPLPASSPV